MTTLVIVDFEATCCNDASFPREEMEIIEVGAVAVRKDTATVVDEYQSFVRPVRNPALTEFCKELTSIGQEDVDAAPGFSQVLQGFGAWLGERVSPVFCSWGDYDRKQLRQDCDFHGVPYPFDADHRNLKKEFSRTVKSRKRFGVGQAMRRAGLSPQGTAHRAIDDARNIARIYGWMTKERGDPQREA